VTLDNAYFEPYFKGTNFGSTDYADLILEGLLKVATYYHNGMTMSTILIEAGWVELKGKKQERRLTQEGATLLYKLIEQRKVL
jgi:hypothetical protein